MAASPAPLPVPSAESPAVPPAFTRPLELERSFFAQPEPLNSTAGAAIDFRSVPSRPQTGQNLGAGASMPWMTSVTWPQDAQT